jgi:HK97 family phage major capsid protein
MRKQIDALTKKRNEHLDAMTKLSDLAANENRLFTEDETKAFDKDQSQVADIDAQLIKLTDAEKAMGERARPAPAPLAPEQRGEVVPFKPFKGQAFTRYIGALALCKGNIYAAADFAKRWEDQTPEVPAVLRAAVAAGTTTDPVWAAPLVDYRRMNDEFIELLRPETIIGRLNYQTVPFNIKIPRQTAGATANWVGEGLSKPVSRLTFDDVTLPWAKIAVICVITQELARFSSPSAELLVRNDLIATIAQFMDQQLLDKTVAPVAALKPGAITNNKHEIPSSGATIAAITTDLVAAMLWMTQPPNNLSPRSPVWIMSAANAMFLATLRTAQDVFAFPGMSLGGTPGVLGSTPSLLGIPVLTTPNIGNDVVLVDQTQIMVADDGQTMIDTSTEASLQMDSAPATPPTPLVSLWQQNLLAIKAERFIYWMMRRDAAIVLITGFPAAGP